MPPTCVSFIAVRVRPLSEKDRAIPRFSNMSESDVLKIQNSSLNVIPHQKTFTFDYVFGPNSTQDEIFVTLASPLIHKFIDGYNVTILAYGQTSSGKTYTMGTAQHGDTDDLQQEGIIPRAMSLLFETLNRSSTPGLRNGRSKLEKKFRPLSVPAAFDDLRRNKSSIKVSFVEIYNEDLVDLLNPAPPSERPLVTIREDSKGQIYWSGVRELPVENTNDVLNFLEQGTQNRATGATDMNEKSSRSHAIFSVTLRQEKWVPSSGQSSPIMSLQRSPSPSVSGNKASGLRRPESSIGFRPPDNAEDGEWIITHSKFHFVDLAGSERLKRTAAEGDRRKEGININGGLLALGNVISALGDPSKKSTHVPYRDSKLTRLLQDSLGGNATTLMIACVSPAEYNLIETVNTLMYANRARNIRNRLEKNEFEEWQTNDNAEFLRGVITKLKAELRAAKTASITSSTISKDMTASSLSLASDGHSSPSTIPDMDQVFLDQRNEIMNLQHLIEKLEGELAVTHEREQVAEEQLKQMWKTDQGPRPEDIEKLKQEVDFEHLVEPVIEEYEKSISVLESQLAMARAALHHSDIGFEEQSARIVHQEQINESQSHIIEELKARISKVVEREQSNDLYIQELESKLSKASQETIRDQESLNDLKTKLSKLTETEESTEQYIVTLEQRLANVEKEKDSLVDTVQALEISSAAKDSSNQALKLRLEQAERGDDKKMLLLELDDALQRYQELESEHGALRVKYEALIKSSTANGDHKQQTDEKGDIQNAEQDSTTDKAQKRLSRSFQEEVNAHQQAVEVIEKEKQIVTLNAQIAHLQKDLSVLESENQETHKMLDITVKAHAEATSQIEKLEKIVQEHLANAEEENLISSEPEEVAVVGLHEEMERELVSSKQREQVLQSEVEKVQQELQLLTSKLTVQENDRSQLQHAVADVQQKLEAAQAEIQDASVRQQDLTNNFDAERALLQKSASHLESEIELLKLESAGLKAQIETIQAEVNKYEAEKATVAVEEVPKIANGHAVVNHVDKTVVDGLQQKLVDKENLLLELNETVSTLQKQLSESTLSTQTLTQKVLDLTNAQEEATKMSVTYSELNTKHHELQQELDAHKEQLTGSQELSTSLRKQLDDSVAEQKTLSQQLSDLATTVSQSEDFAKEHEAQYADLLAKLKATEDQLDASNKSVVSLQSELAESVAASATLMQKLSESPNAKAPSTSAEDFEIKYQQLQAQLHESEASHNLTRESIQLLQKQIDESNTANSKLTQQLAELTNAQVQPNLNESYQKERTELQLQLEAREAELAELNEHIQMKQTQHNESVSALRATNAKLAEQLSQHADAQYSIKDSYEKQQQELQQTLDASESELAELNEHMQTLQKQHEESISALHATNAKLAEQLSQHADAQYGLKDSYEKQQQELQQKLDASESELAELNELIQTLQKQHEESISALHATNAKLAEQLSQHADAQYGLKDSYEKQQQELQQKLDASESELAELNELIQTLQKQHEESISALHATNAKLAEQLSQHADAQYGLKDSYEKQQQELQQKLDASESELAELNELIQTLQKQHEESISALHATNAKLAEQLSQHADAQYGLKDSYEKQQQELQQKLDASESELAELNELIQTLQKQHEESISALEEANANLIQQLSEYARSDAQSNASDVYEKERQNLQLKLDSSETRFAELNQRIQSLQKQYDESISALEIANAKLSSYSPAETKANLIPEAEHQRVLDDLQIHVSKLAASTEKSEGLQKDLSEMKISHSAIHQQLAELTATLSGTEAEVRSLQSAVEEKSTAARESELRGQQLQSEIDGGAASLKELSDKHDTALQRLSELEQQHSELQYKHDLVANERQSILEQSKLGSQTLRSSIDEMARRMESLQTDKDDVESRLMAQQELSQTLQSTITELANGLDDMRAARDSAEQNLEIQREQTGQVQSALEKQLEITSNLEASISEMKVKLAEIEAEAAEAAAVAQSTHQREREEEVELYENAIMELESKLQNVYADHSEIQKASTARHNEAELQLTKTREEIVERDMFIVELEKSVDKMENELKVSAEKLKEKSDAYLHLQQVADGHESEIARLGQELELAKQKINDNENEKLQKLDQKLKALQEETEEYNVLIEQMDSDIQTKSAEMEEIIAELAAAESAKVQSQARVKELEEELLEVRSAIVEPPSVERNVEGVDDQVSAYQAQLADANAQLKEVSQEKAALSGQLEQLTVDNAQLQAKLSIIENKLETQSLKMSKEAEDLRQEIGKLLAKNDQLEKEVLPQLNNKRSSRTFAATRDSTTSIVSPPQTPRITSPSPDTLQNKLKLHENTIAQQASLIKTLEDKVQQSVSTSRASLDINRSPTVTDKLTMRKSTSSPSLPPPPSEPLPPLPVVLGHAKATSISSMKSGSTPDESQHSASIITTEQFEKTIRSLQKKLSAAEMDIKAHLEVITKLEQQLFRAENALKENRKRANFSPTRASTSDDSEVDKLKKQVEQASAQLTSQQEKSAKDLKKLQDDLDAERKAREKAEKARVILENRIDQLMSKKSKFMCF